ncbi:glucokinase regulatory protein [Crocuta crocuta]
MPGTKRFQHVIETPEPGKWELSGYEAALPITEKSNPLTQDLDKADAEQIVRLLGQCDAEIFQEEGQVMPTYQRLYSESILTTMVQVAGKVQEVLKEPEGGLVVLSGGGTSGRMAFLMSVSFNQLMKGLGQKPLYTYLIAGGDRSVVASREGTEDSALHGIEELKKVAAGKKRVIVIGISVGLSAPFVAGQMDYCMDNPTIFLPVLVGFNPVSVGPRNDPIEDWSSTFRQIAERMQRLQEKQEAFVLNPAIGPEGLSGSSRMKGGSATKILLETLLLAAHKTVDRGIAASQRHLLEILRTFERAHQVTYSQSPKIAALMKQASTSLKKKGRVYLVGWQTLGIIAIMDGVECIHTFGADFQDVRGFLIGDHSDMFNQKAELINQGPQFSFSQEDFLTSILPSLTEIDTVVFIFTLDDNLTEVQTLVEQVKEKTANIQALAHSTVGQSLPSSLKKLFPSIFSITWPLLFFEYEGNFIQKFQHELSTKWVLNTVSTGAHVLLGKILQNHMLDFRIHNSKLFWRALAMLQRFSGQPKARCIETLLQVIHFPQPLSDDTRAAPISFHVQVAHEKEQVIPMALLSLLSRCSIPEAQVQLAAAPSVCEAVKSALTGPGRKRSAEPLETLEPALQ